MSHQLVRRSFQAALKPETKAGSVVIAFIADLTYATESTLGTDSHETVVMSAKREIWLAINNVLRLSEQDIRDLQERVGQWSDE